MPESIDKINFASAAVKLWQGDENSIQPVSDSANYVFSFIKTGKKYYLRLASSDERTKNQIAAELDFVAFLQRGGLSVATPAASVGQRLIEEINFAGTLLFACVFEEAEGERFTYDPDKSNREHFRLRGETLGQIHALSREYRRSGNFRRLAWDEDKLLVEAERFLPETETIIWQKFGELKDKLRVYPQSGETFGLIHGDFGETNYRFQNNRLNVFDFDDSCYHWFLYDIAVTIYPHGWRREGRQLLDWLLEGYSRKMSLEIKLSDITMFCEWRLVYMFLVYARKWGLNNLTPPQAEWLAHKRENIAHGYSWQE